MPKYIVSTGLLGEAQYIVDSEIYVATDEPIAAFRALQTEGWVEKIGEDNIYSEVPVDIQLVEGD